MDQHTKHGSVVTGRSYTWGSVNVPILNNHQTNYQNSSKFHVAICFRMFQDVSRFPIQKCVRLFSRLLKCFGAAFQKWMKHDEPCKQLTFVVLKVLNCASHFNFESLAEKLQDAEPPTFLLAVVLPLVRMPLPAAPDMNQSF